MSSGSVVTFGRVHGSFDRPAGPDLPLVGVTHSNEMPPPSPTRRWRVAFCITELDPGGAERQIVRLATNLDRRLFEPEMICLSGEGALIDSLRAAGVPVTCLHARGRRDFSVVLRLRRHFRRTRPDLLQTFLFHANIAGRVAAWGAGVRVVISGIRVAEQRIWQLRVDRATDRLVDRHVCVSRAVAAHSSLAGGLPADKLVVIPNAVDAARFAGAKPADLSMFGFLPSSKVVLFVGRLDPQKDPIRLLEAFRPIVSRHPDARLLFVGTGSIEPELRRLSGDLGTSVAFAGRREDVPALMKASACLALPSRWEGMPNVVLEAIASGIPVVASDAEGVSELLPKALGTIVHNYGVHELSSALEATLYGAPTPPEVVRRSQVDVISRHTTDSVVSAYKQLYLQCLVGDAEIASESTAGARV